MQIILWRHAQAHFGNNDDWARPLTEKGHRQAREIAKKINKIIPKNAIIGVSPAVRSQETAAYLSRETTMLPELHPEALARDLLAKLQAYQADDFVVWVGHQYWIGDLAGFLLTKSWAKQPVWIAKGAFWQFEIEWFDDDFAAKLLKVKCPD